ncbi:MAG: nucleotidyltransferase family protein [Mitsuokella sp.]
MRKNVQESRMEHIVVDLEMNPADRTEAYSAHGRTFPVWKAGKRMNLRQDIRDAICHLAERHGMKKVVLFGSRARGDSRERSDIDLAVIGGDVVSV